MVKAALSGQDSNLSPDANSCAHDEQGDNPGQEKQGLTVFSINCDSC